MANHNALKVFAERAVPLAAATIIGSYALRLYFSKPGLYGEFSRQDKRFLKRYNIDPDRLFEPVRTA